MHPRLLGSLDGHKWQSLVYTVTAAGKHAQTSPTVPRPRASCTCMTLIPPSSRLGPPPNIAQQSEAPITIAHISQCSAPNRCYMTPQNPTLSTATSKSPTPHLFNSPSQWSSTVNHHATLPTSVPVHTSLSLAAAYYLSTTHLLHNHRYYLLQPTLPRCLTYCYTSLPSLASASVDQHASRRVRARTMRQMLQFYLASPLLSFPAMLTHTSRLWLWSPSIDAHPIT
jgi:hypothetical protein